VACQRSITGSSAASAGDTSGTSAYSDTGAPRVVALIAVLRNVTSRYGRNSSFGPRPSRNIRSTRVNASATRSSRSDGVFARHAAARLAATRCRSYSTPNADTSPDRTAEISSASGICSRASVTGILLRQRTRACPRRVGTPLKAPLR
jgi:hypothetical protein